VPKKVAVFLHKLLQEGEKFDPPQTCRAVKANRTKKYISPLIYYTI